MNAAGMSRVNGIMDRNRGFGGRKGRGGRFFWKQMPAYLSGEGIPAVYYGAAPSAGGYRYSTYKSPRAIPVSMVKTANPLL